MQRYDRAEITATKTPEGFIRDAPVIGRTGILIYQNADGTIKREYRPPEEAFNKDSLASIMGKPITIAHKDFVTADNAAKIAPVGTVLTEGRKDEGNIRADVVIYHLDTDARELSCGYTLTLDETPGTTPEGEAYDAIQRNIRYNHLAIVPRGRAGRVARLNMDGDEIMDFDEGKDDLTMSDKQMSKIRLDSGLEYDAAPEVGVYVESLKKDIYKLHKDAETAKADAKKDIDKLQAKCDALDAELAKEKDARKKDAEEAKKNFDAAVKARVTLLDVAKTHKIEKADSLTDKEIKIAVIKAVRGDKLNLDDKSDEYIEAAFDMAKDEEKNREDNMANQRADVSNKQGDGGENNRDDADDPAAALQKLMDEEAKAYLQEVK